MVIDMATGKITITIPKDQLDEVRALVAAGQASTVSGFVQHAVRVALQDARGWRDMLHQALDQTGGPPTAEERAWADSILLPPVKTKGPKTGNAA